MARGDAATDDARGGGLRFKFPRLANNRSSAFLLAGGLALFGFLVGAGILLLATMGRAGSGPLAFLYRPQRVTVDPAFRLQAAVLPTPTSMRPEAWQTPLGLKLFPPNASASTGDHSTRVVFQPGRSQPVLSLPPIRNAVGLTAVSAFVAFNADDDPRTPEPFRASPLEANQLTLGAQVADTATLATCTLALRGRDLVAVNATPPAELGDCAAGLLTVAAGRRVRFLVQYDSLPNHRTQDGTWREGDVFGRTEVRVSLSE